MKQILTCVSAMSSAIHCNILLPWSPFQTRSRYLNSSSYCTMPMFKGTGRSDNARVDISFSFSRFSNQGVKCLSDNLSFVSVLLELVQKRLCDCCSLVYWKQDKVVQDRSARWSVLCSGGQRVRLLGPKGSSGRLSGTSGGLGVGLEGPRPGSIGRPTGSQVV